MGAIDYISKFCSLTKTKNTLLRKKKRKALQTVELKVKIDCDGCERRVKHAAESIEGATSVEVNRKQNRVIVTGYVEPKEVMEAVKGTGKVVEFWPYVRHDLVSYPYATQAYDKYAPTGFVKNVTQARAAPNASDENYMTFFSDDNTNACSIM